MDKAISVTELNTYIKGHIERDYFLNDVYVKGEISNFKRHQSGTLYFSIKDENSRINVVVFPNYAQRVNASLKDGDQVLIKGKISVYTGAGSYQIQASEIIFDSIGQLYIKYEELKRKLEAKGYFDEVHKKPIPKFPQRIGIITAKEGAAIHDMIKTIRSRWPIADIILFPSLVQGSNASKNIVSQIKKADFANLDVIICGRGGGSIEDLWPFNEEIVADAIFACKTPLVSAVGHQSDFTISDFVADRRGLTPTDAGVIITPLISDVLDEIDEYKYKLINLMTNYINYNKEKVLSYQNSFVLNNIDVIYAPFRQKLDNLTARYSASVIKMTNNYDRKLYAYKTAIINNFNSLLIKNRNTLSHHCSLLDSLSPLKVVKRGYSIVKSQDDKVITSLDSIKINQEIQVELKDGVIVSKVIEKRN